MINNRSSFEVPQHSNQNACDCHMCTQARYRTSFQYQLDSAMGSVLTEPQSAEEFYDKTFEPKVAAGKSGLEAMFIFAEAYAASVRDATDTEPTVEDGIGTVAPPLTEAPHASECPECGSRRKENRLWMANYLPPGECINPWHDRPKPVPTDSHTQGATLAQPKVCREFGTGKSRLRAF